MKRRPIFVEFSDAEVRMRGLTRKRVGDTFCLVAKLLRGVVRCRAKEPKRYPMGVCIEVC